MADLGAVGTEIEPADLIDFALIQAVIAANTPVRGKTPEEVDGPQSKTTGTPLC